MSIRARINGPWRMADPYNLPEDLIEERFIAASGPGGQNVNKVATAVQLRINIYALGLPLHAFRKLKQLAGSRLNSEGDLVITARRFRTQEANRTDARARVTALIAQSYERDPPRIKTKPSKAAKARRVDAKKSRSNVKQGRGKVRLD